MKSVHYEITVWNQESGEVVKYLPDASEEDLQECRDWFKDEPGCEVVVDRSWEETDDNWVLE